MIFPIDNSNTFPFVNGIVIVKEMCSKSKSQHNCRQPNIQARIER